MSFDRMTGDLWVGDVGWQTWELVYRVQRGGNYGWSITEGSQSIHPNEKRGPTPILPPVMQHDHSEARSITGGFVYHGQRLTELQDAYVYGDYTTGKIWALWYDGVQVTKHLELADTSYQIVAWGETNDGELFFMDHARTNQIYRLVPNRTPSRSEQFPTRLSETGLFSSVREHLPAPGVVPYSVQAGYWADGTQAIRWMALPCAARIQGDLEGEWVFPDGTVFLRTVLMPADAESAGPLRRLETQILHRENDSWRPYTYHWNDVQDDADLVPAEGLVVEWNSHRSSGSPPDLGIHEASEQRFTTWRIASRSECTGCHTEFSTDKCWRRRGLTTALATSRLVSTRPFGAAAVRRSVGQGSPDESLRRIGRPQSSCPLLFACQLRTLPPSRWWGQCTDSVGFFLAACANEDFESAAYARYV